MRPDIRPLFRKHQMIGQVAILRFRATAIRPAGNNPSRQMGVKCAGKDGQSLGLVRANSLAWASLSNVLVRLGFDFFETEPALLYLKSHEPDAVERHTSARVNVNGETLTC